MDFVGMAGTLFLLGAFFSVAIVVAATVTLAFVRALRDRAPRPACDGLFEWRHSLQPRFSISGEAPKTHWIAVHERMVGPIGPEHRI